MRKDKRKGAANRAIAGLKKANDIGLENVIGYSPDVIQRFDKKHTDKLRNDRS